MRRAASGRLVLALALVARVAAADPAAPADPAAAVDPDAAAGSDGEVIEVHGAAPQPPEQPHDTVGASELHALPGGGNDALRGLQSLPGVARIPFGLGGLALRGAAPHDTRVYLDGIEVPILYHFGGVASFLPIDAIDHLELTASGASAAYGDLIGGVVVIDSREPHPTRWAAEGELSLLHAGVLATGPAAGGGSWLVGVRRSYVDAVLAAANVDLGLAPSYADAQVRWESGDRRWTVIAFGSDDDLALVHDPSEAGGFGGVSDAQVRSFDYTSRFARLGVRFQQDGVTITPWLGLDSYDAIANYMDVDKGFSRRDVVTAVRVRVDRRALGGTLSLGLDARATHYDYTLDNVPPPSPGDPMPSGLVHREAELAAADVGLFAEQLWQRGPVSVRPGARIDYYGLAGQAVLDPRLDVTERWGDAVISQSLGAYHESPLVTDLDPAFGPRALRAPESLQASASIEAPFSDLFVAKATAYVQAQSDLPVDVVTGATPISANGGEDAGGLLGISRELIDAQFGSYSYREYIGSGQAWGLELLVRRELGPLTGWIAYTYARAFRTGDPRVDPRMYPYVLDQPHVLTAVGTLPLGRHWRIGGRARLASGNPITPVAGAYFDPDHGKWIAIDGPLLSQRLPTFAQLDLRLDRLWPRPDGTWDLYLDIQNVTDRANPEGVTYSMDYAQRYYTTGLPVFPSIGIEYRPTTW